MYDISPLQPFLIGFFVLAAVAIPLAVVTLMKLVSESRTSRPVVAISAAHPALAAATRHAA
jgi:hypothetical protein